MYFRLEANRDTKDCGRSARQRTRHSVVTCYALCADFQSSFSTVFTMPWAGCQHSAISHFHIIRHFRRPELWYYTITIYNNTIQIYIPPKVARESEALLGSEPAMYCRRQRTVRSLSGIWRRRVREQIEGQIQENSTLRGQLYSIIPLINGLLHILQSLCVPWVF